MINFPKTEEEILKFWQDQKIFKKSLEKDSPKGDFVFYDGPPFATGTPHYGHLVPGTIKDIIPRFKTMQGYHVERKWGWDCHGLPIENIVEQKLGLKDRQDIENIGIDVFCEECRSEVLKYADEWRKSVERTGRWVDMDDDYRTMNPEYMESIWWVFKTLWGKELIYEGYKSMHICPRCETTLSNFEVTQNYKDINDLSVTVKFELVDEPGIYLLAWTTTPWTLPGNVALAVDKDLDYVKFSLKNHSQITDGQYIVSKNDLDNYLNQEEFKKDLAKEMVLETLERFKGKELLGKKYKPLFDYYSRDEKLKNRENGWQVYAADFITTDEGTGIVHIAPAFGEEDMNLGKEKNLPFIQHVDMSGRFKPEVTDWAGELVKPKDNPQATDEKIVKLLADQGKLFHQEVVLHSYPHCWRCDTPLINYAAKSWFVKVTEIRDKLIKNNKLIKWVPEHMKEGRFGKWLEQAKDWAISRSRYWGAPLPVWKCEKCQEMKVIGSIEELKEATNNLFTKIIIVRHGESERNLVKIYDSSPTSSYHLTKNGIEQAEAAIKLLKNEKIDFIYSSPSLRAIETAEVIANKLDLKVQKANELNEINSGEWEGKEAEEVLALESRQAYKLLSIEEQYLATRGKFGESWEDLEDRIYNFVKQLVRENSGKTIVLVTHQAVIIYLLRALKSLSTKEAANLFHFETFKEYARPINTYVDSRTLKQIDLHKHQIDSIILKCSKCAGEMRRIPEVLDCWFESGSMPYGQGHYPFENKEKFEQNFPAQFIAEGQDQTRGWFYTLLVLSTALFNKPAFLKVIVNGLVLAENGKKMSKRLKNYPEPQEVMDKYGADMLRFYLTSGPVVKAEELRFSEKEVRELFNKVTVLLWNVVSFYKLFEPENIDKTLESKNILDKWLKAKLKVFITEVTTGLEAYDLMKATKPIIDFINELSTWYVRRSRDRFKSTDPKEKTEAQATLSQCLMTLVKVMAPFTPFIAEKIYQELKGQQKSVHLEDWPVVEKLYHQDKELLEEMEKVRLIVEDGLRTRSEAGIKVRQPLNYYSTAKVKNLPEELQQIIADELNVKEIKFGEEKLDTAITEDLKAEGVLRELIRAINNLRKEANLTINDQINLIYQTDAEELKKVINKYQREIIESTKSLSIKEFTNKNIEDQQIKELLINGFKVKLVLIKS